MLVKTLTVSHYIPRITARGRNIMFWTAVIVGWFVYYSFPTPVQFICSLFWKMLCSLWQDLQSVVQSPTVRKVVCQAIVGSIRTAGTILILPCIIMERLWPVTPFHQHPMDPPHLKDMHSNPYIPPGGEQPTVKTTCAGSGKYAACGRTKHMPPGETYYCKSHLDQGPR